MPDTAVVSPSPCGRGFGGGGAAVTAPAPPAPSRKGRGRRTAAPCPAPPAALGRRSLRRDLCAAARGQRGGAGAVPVVVDRRPARPADRGGDPGRRAGPHRALRRGRAARAGADDRGSADAERRGRRDLSAGRSRRPADRRQPAALAARGGDATATGTSCRSSAPACARWRWCRAYELPGGFHLLIGRDVQVRAQLRSLLTDALLWALLVVLVMATGGALVVRSLFRRALANVSATAAAIAAGDFTQRVKLSGRGDEFDQLAETINDMLDRIGAADGGRARGVQRHRARPAHADHPRARPAGGRRGARRDGRRNCAPRSSGRPPISTASSRCSRRCCASPRSRPARAARPSPRSTWRRCWPMWPSCTGRWPRRTASR